MNGETQNQERQGRTDDPSMNIVLTGGGGFIGAHLAKRLLDAGHHVRLFDLCAGEAFPHLATIGDIRDRQALTWALRGADAVYHLAGAHHDDVRPASLYYDVNVAGAESLVEACIANEVRRVIQISSAAVYGLSDGVVDESTPPRPVTDYGRSKLQAEAVFQSWVNASSARSLLIVRPVVVFGEGNRANVYNLINQIAGRRFVMVGSGSNRKSMAYVRNLVDLLTEGLHQDSRGEVINYADKPDLSVSEIVEIIRDQLGHANDPLRSVPYWTGLVGGYAFDALSRLSGRRFAISSSRVRKFCAPTQVASIVIERTGFRARWTLEQGLRNMISSLRLPDADLNQVSHLRAASRAVPDSTRSI